MKPFDPIFFKSTKQPNSELVSLNCITIFSEKDETENMLNYDQSLISVLIQSIPHMIEMEFLAIVYNFSELIDTPINEDCVILSSRKLFAIGFFIAQLIKENRAQPYYLEINQLIQNILKNYKKHPALTQVFSCSIAYVLQQIHSKARLIDLQTEEGQAFLAITQSAIKMFNLCSSMNDGSLPFFQIYFMSMLIAFNETTVFTPDLIGILTDIVETVSKSIHIPGSISFNYFALFDRLLYFISAPEEKIPLETKILIFVFASKVPQRFPNASEFIFDDQNISVIANFIQLFLKEYDFNGTKRLHSTTSVADISIKQLPSNFTLDGTFTNGFNIDEDLKNTIKSKEVQLPQPFHSFLEIPKLNIVLNALANLTKYEESCLPRIFHEISKSKGNERFEESVFLAMYVRSLISQNSEVFTSQVYKNHIFDTLADYAFVQFDNEELSKFISNIIIYVLKTSPAQYDIIVKLYTILEEQLTHFECDSLLLQTICQCAHLFQNDIKDTFEKNRFDQRIANLVFMLQNVNAGLISSKLQENNSNSQTLDESLIQKSENCRLGVFFLISFLSDDQIFLPFLAKSESLVGSILQVSNESSLMNFTLDFTSKCLKVLKSNDNTMKIIHLHFYDTIKSAAQEDRYIVFARNCITAIIMSFEYNTINIATTFFSHQFIDNIIQLTIHTKADEDMSLLLKLSQKCTQMKGEFKELFTTFNLYTKIAPAVAKIAKASGREKLLNNLWCLVFQSEEKPKDPHPILDGEPLTLLFQLYREKDNDLLHFIQYINDCCETDTHSTLEVTSSAFPNSLIKYLSEFRARDLNNYTLSSSSSLSSLSSSENLQEKTDLQKELFEEVAKLFAFLSQYSIKSNDLLMLFQNMTSLPNGCRPSYSNSFLMALLLIFQSPFDAPSSFFHFSGKNTCLAFPKINLEESFNQFTFFIDLELLDLTSNGKIIFFDCPTTKTSFSMNLKQNELHISIKKDNTINQDFVIDYQISKESWTFIVLTHDGSKLNLYAHGKERFSIDANQIQFSGELMSLVLAHNIHCNIGSCGFLSTALDENIIHILSSFPRNSQTDFDPSEATNYQQEFMPLFSPEISKSFVFLVSASVSKNNNVSNLAHHRNQDFITLVNGTTYGYYPKSSDVISSIGGPSALIPLFSQLDMPLSKLPKEIAEIQAQESSESQNEEPKTLSRSQSRSDDFDSGYLPILLNILMAYLNDSPSNQQDFSNIDGFKMIATLLSNASPRHLTMQVVELFKQLYSKITCPSLLTNLINDIFLDVRMWMYCDIQVHAQVYKALSDCYDKTPEHLKKVFLQAAPASKILFILKTCYWTQPSEKISLFTKNRVGKNGVEESQRPQDLAPVRKEIWNFAEKIFVDSFTPANANSLITFASDKHDMTLTFETLRFMVKLVRNQNKKFVESIAKHISFDSFFHLLLNKEESLHILCLHIFMMFSNLEKSLRDIFLSPYSYEDWIESMVAVINSSNQHVDFADNIYGYLFGLFTDKEGVLKEQLSKSENLHYSFADTSIISLAVMAVSSFDDDLSKKYMIAIDNALTEKPSSLASIANADVPFLIFLITRWQNPDHRMDKSCEYAINILSQIYISNNQFKLDKMVMFYELMSDKTQNDYSYIARAILQKTIEFMLKMQRTNAQDKILLDIINVSFQFMFMIPNTSKFYDPFPSQNDLKQENKEKISFQEVSLLKMSTDLSPLEYTFATRSTKEGTWLDASLADIFLQACENLPSHFTPKQNILGTTRPLYFMFSFVISIGLRHKSHFSTFERHIRPLTNQFSSDRSLSSLQTTAFINYFAGLISIYMKTDRNHVSHIYLQEDTNAFKPIIRNVLKLKDKIEWGRSIDSFDGCFKSRGHHYAYMILERFSEIEQDMFSNFLKEYEKSMPKTITAIISYNEKAASNYNNLNQLATSQNAQNKAKQATAQLLQFASQMRSQMSQGYKLYKTLIHSMSIENGPWCPPEQHKEHHWKLYDSMQSCYKRGRLIENIDFTDHKDASLLRDLGNITNAQQLYTEHLLQSRITSNISGEENFVFDDEYADMLNNNEQEDIDVLIRFNANLVTMKRNHSGTVTLTHEYIIFENNEHSKYVKINLDTITHLFLRHYLLMDTSLEIYTTSKRAVFFDFPDNNRKAFVNKLKKLKLPQKPFIQQSQSDIQNLIKKATEKWTDGKLTNFDYLMLINIYSGRTYNDLSQYPVFPWVLSNYTSETLDLNDPSNYRDLSCPIGALDKDRLAVMLERLNNADTDDMKYLYGSFYSSAAVVIGFLIRMEPFTSLHIELQSGRFDISDRLFHSIPRCWESINHTTMDFRELIPEFFYLPDFLLNSNQFDLGRSAIGNGDVALPPWASSPHDFIAKNRAALESKFVSENLPKWIDLIFGVTSRGKASIPVNNVYNPNFFSEVITPEMLKDPESLKFAQEYAACFGEAPQKIFDNPHPQKKANIIEISQRHQYDLLCETDSPILSIDLNCTKVITALTNDLQIYSIKTDSSLQYETKTIPQSLGQKAAPICSIYNGSILYANPWDRAFSVSNQSGVISFTKRSHMSNITALSLSQDYYATGSVDTTLILWDKKQPCNPHSLIPLHQAPITCISVNDEADMCVGCSSDGYITTSSLITGQTNHSLLVPCGVPSLISVLRSGTICISFLDDSGKSTVKIFDQNLNQFNELAIEDEITSMCAFEWSNGYEYLFIAQKSSRLAIYQLLDMGVIWEEAKIDLYITSSVYRQGYDEIVMGTKCGKIISTPLH